MNDDDADDDRLARLRKAARRLLDRKDLAGDTRELVSGLLDTGDRAKNEAVKLVAREVRSYLEALQLKEELVRIVRSHSLEISLRLKPLDETPKDKPEP